MQPAFSGECASRHEWSAKRLFLNQDEKYVRSSYAKSAAGRSTREHSQRCRAEPILRADESVLIATARYIRMLNLEAFDCRSSAKVRFSRMNQKKEVDL